MNIEAVTVCVNYSDFLYVALTHNIGLVDRWIVVTSPEDTETRQVCHDFDIQCVISDEHRRGNATFNKGRMIEQGLRQCSFGSWRLHMDADIVLPTQFRHVLAAAHPQTHKIYGCDRLMIRSWDAYLQHIAPGFSGHRHCVPQVPSVPIGFRWALNATGYVPIGFFQLWHSDADEWRGRRVRHYPVEHGSACRTDVQFALQWDRKDRELVPELIVAHLESEQCENGTNWKGRKTKPFGPGGHHHHQHHHHRHHKTPDYME